MKSNSLSLFLLCDLLIAAPISANDDPVETITVTTHASTSNNPEALQKRLAELGVGFSQAGGVSSLPVMNGMMGDRIQLLTDGAPITAACGNQMNPPLSYVSSNQVKTISVIPGISPVSSGGDNIAGVIEVSTLEPAFSDSDDFLWQQGNLGYTYMSNGNGKRIHGDATLASAQWYIRYSGVRTESESYDDGRGDKVLDTLYKSTNHAISAGYQDTKQRLQLKLTRQSIPYQGFPNQYMDMTDNKSIGILTRYERQFNRVSLDSVFSILNVDHEMGFFSEEKTGTMPMNTDSQDIMAKFKWQLPDFFDGTLLIGQEWYKNTLDDWWPAVEGSMMMGPNDYVNINNGKRERTAAYIDWLSAQDQQWTYRLGSRLERVTTNTGDVQAYQNADNGMGMDNGMMNMAPMAGMMSNNVSAAADFNNTDRKRDNWLLDVAFSATLAVADDQQFVVGVARKNRAPNLYERYSWGTSAMATSMIGWFGDGNGYIGNIDLEPETAYTASFAWQQKTSSWHTKVDGWYTRANDFIDATVTGTFNRTGTPEGERNTLTFTNLDARLYGVNLEGSHILLEQNGHQLAVSDLFSWQNGERTESDEDLYQIVPVQNRLQLNYTYQQLSASLEWQWVGNKHDVDGRRRENPTDAYSLLNVDMHYQWNDVSFRFTIQNLMNEYYALPLGGVSIAAFNVEPDRGFSQLAGAGRSVDVGMSVAF
ncbi:TonB-dependent receptor [Aestuariibacter sp. A3R04]|uniref:TonB-dependent receptor n=1 Tax=Aestuariibacter sp. A3R04 TaxID=2841571 RepID=UPI0020914FE1|nr:TonB-dependent receptor [Aestuariibacter sp. A3R04]